MDALALELETDARDALDWSPGGAYRADGTLGTAHKQLFLVFPTF